MDSLKNFNARRLYRQLELPEGEFGNWLMELGLLHSKRTCDCGGNMSLRERKEDDKRGSQTWRCTKKSCRKEKGYLVGTWFEGTHLSLKDVFQLSYFFARQTHSQHETQFDMQREDGSTVGEHAVVDWKHMFRQACGWYFSRNSARIGGRDKVVEIDETVLTKRKYHRGQLRAEQQWFFGGVERGNSENCFLVPVEKRDAATLLPIIAKYVRRGTTVISDGWAAYGGIERIQIVKSGEQAYSHFTVNHSENFVDPETGAHTQTIEGTWSHFKSRHKEERGTSRELFSSYIYQFLWRKKFAGPDALYHLWSQIAELYPCEK